MKDRRMSDYIKIREVTARYDISARTHAPVKLKQNV